MDPDSIRRAAPDETIEARAALAGLRHALFGRKRSLGRLGRYELLESLGTGAVGVVFSAHDPELDRKVAIKILRAGKPGSPRSLDSRRRLIREAQAIARVSHPNVVEVYDVGSYERGVDDVDALPDDVPDRGVFIVMELLPGKDLKEWIENGPHSYKEVLGVFTKAARGIAAAHRAGLIHRDFKPANVLIGEDGRVRVLDFGLARFAHSDASIDGSATAASGPPIRAEGDLLSTRSSSAHSDFTATQAVRSLTNTGAIIGTPAYMAPEQHWGEDVDARSDQFSFCVALFEALYGLRPFSGRTSAELGERKLANVLEPIPQEVRLPPAVAKAVARGLTPEPSDRWPSMDDLVRELTGTGRRRTRRTMLASAAVVAVAGTAIVATFGASRDPTVCAGASDRLTGVWESSNKEGVRASLLQSGVPYAEESWRLVERRIDGWIAGWTAQYSDACEATHVRGEQPGEVLDLRMRCLGDRLRELESLIGVLTRADAKIAEGATRATASLPLVDGCAETDSLRADLDPPSAAIAESVAAVRADLIEAGTLAEAQKFDDAIALASRGVESSRALDYPPLEAEALHRLGSCYDAASRSEQAAEVLAQAWWAADASHHDHVAALAAVRLIHLIGVSLGRHAEADQWARHAEAAVHRVPGDVRLQVAYSTSLGALSREQGKYRVARQHQEQALALAEARLGFPSPEVANAVSSIAILAHIQGQREQAVALHRRAGWIEERVHGSGHPRVATTWLNLAVALGSLERAAEAHGYLEDALEIFTAVYGPNDPQVAAVLQNIGIFSMGATDFAGAEAHNRRALVIMERAFGTDHPHYGMVLTNLGVCLTGLERLDEALEAFDRALSIRERVLGPAHPDLSYTLVARARVEGMVGSTDSAVAHLERALVILEDAAVDPIRIAAAEATLAEILAAAGRDRERARALAERALVVFRARGGLGDEVSNITEFLAGIDAEG